jgi:hypothetical protein
MPNPNRKLADMTAEEFREAFRNTVVSEAEMEAQNPQLAGMRKRSREAIQRLQSKGILDKDGKLVRPNDLPPDARPGSKAEC